MKKKLTKWVMGLFSIVVAFVVAILGIGLVQRLINMRKDAALKAQAGGNAKQPAPDKVSPSSPSPVRSPSAGLITNKGK